MFVYSFYVFSLSIYVGGSKTFFVSCSVSKAIVVKPLHASWKQKQAERLERKQTKAKETELKAEAEAEKAVAKAKRAEKRKRREENEKKSMVYQVITNPHKIRKMTKKQARQLQKVL